MSLLTHTHTHSVRSLFGAGLYCEGEESETEAHQSNFTRFKHTHITHTHSVRSLFGAGLYCEGEETETEAHQSNFTRCGGDGVCAVNRGSVVLVDSDCSWNGYAGAYARGFESRVRARGCSMANNTYQGVCAARGAYVDVFNCWVCI
jgi:hypothetical protein